MAADPGPEHPRSEQDVSYGAIGGITFAACILTLVGFFQIIAGVAAIVDDEFFVVTRNYTFDLDTSAWGWIHLILGLLLLATGFGLFRRSVWAGVTAIFLAALSAVANFFFIPYYPFWAILLIALDVWVIWSITRPGAIRT
jgi:predicted Na+-dependent transporter